MSNGEDSASDKHAATLRSDFLTMLDEMEAALRQKPKDGYDGRCAEINVGDYCDAGAETVVAWEFDQADIDMLREALAAPSAASTPGQTWCEHAGGLGPPFPFCKICDERASESHASSSEPVAWAVVDSSGDPREANSIHWPATCRHDPHFGDAKAAAQSWADKFGYSIVPLIAASATRRSDG